MLDYLKHGKMRYIRQAEGGLTMRSLFIAVLLILTPFGNVAQESSMKADGRMWQSYGSLGQDGVFVKAAYVRGIIDGLQVGALVGYFDGRTDADNEVLSTLKQCINKGTCAVVPSLMEADPNTAVKQAMTGAEKVRTKLLPGNNASVLDIVHQTDKFYSDYRNTPVCMVQAVQESIHSLSGTASTEASLEMMRNPSGCK